MAYGCRMMNKECDACGACEEKPVLTDLYGASIYKGENYYFIDGEIVSKDNLWKWAEVFEEEA